MKLPQELSWLFKSAKNRKFSYWRIYTAYIVRNGMNCLLEVKSGCLTIAWRPKLGTKMLTVNSSIYIKNILYDYINNHSSKWVKKEQCFTFKIKGFIPARIEGATSDFGFQSIFLIWKKGNSHVRIRRSAHILGWQVFGLKWIKIL